MREAHGKGQKDGNIEKHAERENEKGQEVEREANTDKKVAAKLNTDGKRKLASKKNIQKGQKFSCGISPTQINTCRDTQGH